MHIPQTEVILKHGGVELVHLTLPPGAYVVGRESGVEIFADTPLISRQHARLTINSDQVVLEDLGSSNGTFVADQPIKEPTRLFPNQTVRLGDVSLEIHRQRTPTEPGVSLAPAQAALERILPAELLGQKRYAIGEQIARGGMGAILDAHEGPTKRHVAMKVMLDSGDAGDVLRFVEEAQITAQLDHPNIVPIHELGINEHGQPFYTMKLVRGITLKTVLDLLAQGDGATAKQYPVPALLTIFQKACDAVAFAHSRGVIHRDLKPENIMLGDFGSVLVMDWGLAKVVGKDSDQYSVISIQSGPAPAANTEYCPLNTDYSASRTLAGTIMGTPQYMSPEQARGEVETLDARSDVFALGAILFEMLHFRRFITGESTLEVIDKVAHEDFDWTPSKKPVPGALLAVCRKALAFDRELRYASVEDFQRDLTAYQAGFATSAEKAGAWTQLTLLVKRHRALFGSAAAAVLIIAVVVAIAFQRVAGERNVAVKERNRAEQERKTADRERDRAETALTNLAKTAPTFAAMADGLVEQGNFEEALVKIGYAVSLDRRNPDYLLRQGHLLEATQNLAPAADSYRAVLALRPDPAAKLNRELCERLLRATPAGAGLTRESQGLLLESMLKQDRAVEAGPLSQIVGQDSATVLAAVRARLKPILALTGPGAGAALLSNGTVRLNLANKPIVELPSLGDLPISEIDLSFTKISDLTPLNGLRLRSLKINETLVSDLSPLAGMPLESLSLMGTKVSDLTALKKMPLKEFLIWSRSGLRDITPLAGIPLEKLTLIELLTTDLSVLRGMPLREADIRNGNLAVVPDFSALAHAPLLEKVGLPQDVSDIAFLATLPRLQQVKYLRDGTVYPESISARDFLAMYGPEVPEIKAARAALATAGVKDLPIRRIFVDADHFLHLDLAGHPLDDLKPLRGLPIVDLTLRDGKFRDLEPLRGMPIKKLKLLFVASTSVNDLGPLRGMPINVLHLSGMKKVTSLEPLRGMPISDLILSGTSATDLGSLRGMPLLHVSLHGIQFWDVGILADFPDLETILLPDKAINVERLRTLPKLRLLSSSGSDTTGPAQTVAQFWKEYDAQKATGKK